MPTLQVQTNVTLDADAQAAFFAAATAAVAKSALAAGGSRGALARMPFLWATPTPSLFVGCFLDGRGVRVARRQAPRPCARRRG